MDRQKVNQIIGQLEKSITEIEPLLNEEEFSDYCDNTYTAIAYWRKLMKNLQ